MLLWVGEADGLGPREQGFFSQDVRHSPVLPGTSGSGGSVVACVAGAGWQEMVMLHACKGCHGSWRGEVRA